MNTKKQILLICAVLFITCMSGMATSKSVIAPRLSMDLSGTWNFTLDPHNKGVQNDSPAIKLEDTIILPGTTDSNRKGAPNTKYDETTYLSRTFKYVGPAWYSREVNITKDWAGKRITLFLERTRPTTVWVDGKMVGKCNYLSVPHRYDLTKLLTVGKHTITIRVDNGNSIPGEIREYSHSCTESTQTNWNGIIGQIELQGVNKQYIKKIKATPNVADRTVKVNITLAQAPTKGEKITLSANAFNSPKNHSVKPLVISTVMERTEYEITYPIGKEALLWSEFSPALYRLTAKLGKSDIHSVTFGMREFKIEGKQFTINGTKTFLRGKHDACVFPLTAYTPMNVNEWRRYFSISKEYGINHVRFHSWCPPAACFEAADLEGIYLQPELTIWGGFSTEAKELMDFLFKDGEQIQLEYSNSPSFVMFALGNELNGNVNLMRSFIDRFRKIDDRHAYALGSNNFLGRQGSFEGEDFFVTCRVGADNGFKTHVRASFSFADAYDGGYLNSYYPNSTMTFDGAVEKSTVPVIGHETGQFQIFPNFNEMKKYTGVLEPRNFEVFRKRLEKAGMLDQANDFLKASGALSVLLYRADIEMNLRTRDMAGFQLLDLQDYPGQGSAFVGIMDAFMDSKGLVTPEKWREFCSEVVPMFVTEKFCWSGGEELNGTVEIANYGQEIIEGKTIAWRLISEGEILGNGSIKVPAGSGLLKSGDLSIKLPAMTKAQTAILELSIDDTKYKNSYPLWLYPANNNIRKTEKILVTHDLNNNVLATLKAGGKVFLLPRVDSCAKGATVGGLFQSDYWNYRMFKTICEGNGSPVSPGTLGILTNPDHKIFNDFPTDYHSNWQWFSIIKNSYPLILDRMPQGFKPIVQVIDNIERNHKLGLVFELNVDSGKLLICMANLDTNNKPEVRQFYNSILNYMESADFKPKTIISTTNLQSLFTTEGPQGKIKSLQNISGY